MPLYFTKRHSYVAEYRADLVPDAATTGLAPTNLAQSKDPEAEAQLHDEWKVREHDDFVIGALDRFPRNHAILFGCSAGIHSETYRRRVDAWVEFEEVLLQQRGYRLIYSVLRKRVEEADEIVIDVIHLSDEGAGAL